MLATIATQHSSSTITIRIHILPLHTSHHVTSTNTSYHSGLGSSTPFKQRNRCTSKSLLNTDRTIILYPFTTTQNQHLIFIIASPLLLSIRTPNDIPCKPFNIPSTGPISSGSYSPLLASSKQKIYGVSTPNPLPYDTMPYYTFPLQITIPYLQHTIDYTYQLANYIHLTPTYSIHLTRFLL